MEAGTAAVITETSATATVLPAAAREAAITTKTAVVADMGQMKGRTATATKAADMAATAAVPASGRIKKLEQGVVMEDPLHSTH